ncbi:MAG: hypothetical protein PWQ88_355 [Candidatus Methanomethylophilaceae archaeon]|nr:hypothetical protein [Candidatus Methanomethylophilaceae archaeon]MDI3542274.1 hypothetical protein [Candidatus Methanomethylophilaceae archaeon]HIJ00932.1 hypothetical protein [Candidatus Methanomethylophilaceae archaeon]
MNDEELKERTMLLEKAGAKLEECIELVEMATRMSPLSRRADTWLLPRLRECLDSLDEASVANLIRDLEYMSEEHPIWTRPLTSVKYINRRD